MSHHPSVWCSLLLVGAIYSILSAQGPPAPTERREYRNQDQHTQSPEVYPRIDLPRKGTPTDLRAAADQFAKHYECSMCEGTGKLKKAIDGAEGKTIDVRCVVCRGSQYTSGSIIHQDLEQLVLAWARLDESHPDAPAAMDHAAAILKRASALNHSKFRELINEPFKRANFRENFHLTRALFFIGKINDAAKLPGGDLRSFAASVPGAAGKKPFVAVVVTPGFAEAQKDKVLVAGIYVGDMRIAPFENVAVLQHGFMVGVH